MTSGSISLAMAICGASLALQSCAVITSESISDTNGSYGRPSSGQGIIYFLPTQRMKLVAVRKSEPVTTLAEAQKQLDSALATERSASTELKSKQAESKEAKKNLEVAQKDNAPSTAEYEDAYKKADKAMRDASAAATNASERVTKAKEALAVALTTPNDVKFRNVYSVKLELLAPEPDSTATFFAKANHNPMRDDTTKISVNEKGLLTSSNVVSADRTGDILVELAGLAGIIAFPPTAAVPEFSSTGDKIIASAGRRGPICTFENPVTLEVIFDPIDWIEERSQHVQAAKQTLATCFNRSIRISRLALTDDYGAVPYPEDLETDDAYEYLGPEDDEIENGEIDSAPVGARYENRVFVEPVESEAEDETDASTSTDDKASNKTKANGYAYRAKVPYLVDVIRLPTESELKAIDDDPYGLVQVSESSVVVLLPNEGPVGWIPVRSSAFVTTTNDVTFKDGMVTSWDRTRPSEVLEVVRLPIRMAKAFFSIPTELIQFRVNLNNQQSALVNAQAAQQKAETALIVLQACLDNAAAVGADIKECVK